MNLKSMPANPTPNARHTWNIWLGTFMVAIFIQTLMWHNFDYVDKTMWGDEAHFLEVHDPEAFNPLVAYGHPGGPPLVFTIAAHHLFNLTYTDALSGSLALLN